jgi:alternate signal-mediated exported protein
MNKLVKAAIAGAAGIALLLGGAGTFALWNSSTTVTSGTIVAGNLVVADSGTAGTWTANGATIAIASYKAAPGDVLKFTKTVNVTATGDNLVATLGLGVASITPTTANKAADVALASALNSNAVLTASGSSITANGSAYTVAAGTAGIVAQPVVVTATLTFPKSTTAGAENAAELGSVKLNDFTVTLTQN